MGMDGFRRNRSFLFSGCHTTRPLPVELLRRQPRLKHPFRIDASLVPHDLHVLRTVALHVPPLLVDAQDPWLAAMGLAAMVVSAGSSSQ